MCIEYYYLPEPAAVSAMLALKPPACLPSVSAKDFRAKVWSPLGDRMKAAKEGGMPKRSTLSTKSLIALMCIQATKTSLQLAW